MPREWRESKQTVPAKLYELEKFRIVNEAIASQTSPRVWPLHGSTVDLFRRGHVGRWLHVAQSNGRELARRFGEH